MEDKYPPLFPNPIPPCTPPQRNRPRIEHRRRLKRVFAASNSCAAGPRSKVPAAASWSVLGCISINESTPGGRPRVLCCGM